jgi:hypothetical protein
MRQHPNSGGHRRLGKVRMAEDMEWLVPMAPVRDADRRLVGSSLPVPQRPVHVAELRRRARDGYYASESMMDLLARRLLAAGDL